MIMTKAEEIFWAEWTAIQKKEVERELTHVGNCKTVSPWSGPPDYVLSNMDDQPLPQRRTLTWSEETGYIV